MKKLKDLIEVKIKVLDALNAKNSVIWLEIVLKLEMIVEVQEEILKETREIIERKNVSNVKALDTSLKNVM